MGHLSLPKVMLRPGWAWVELERLVTAVTTDIRFGESA